MSIELIVPNFKGNDREQLKQIQSYLYQLVSQLQFALNQMDVTAEHSAIDPDSDSANFSKETDVIHQKIKKLTDRIDHLESVLQNAGISTVKNTDEQQNFSEEA